MSRPWLQTRNVRDGYLIPDGRVSSSVVLVIYPFCHDSLKLLHVLGIEKQGAVLRLESSNEGVHLGIVSGAVEGMGYPHAVP